MMRSRHTVTHASGGSLRTLLPVGVITLASLLTACGGGGGTKASTKSAPATTAKTSTAPPTGAASADAPAPASNLPPPTVAPPRGVLESQEKWSFGGKPGKLYRTTHYRLFTTETSPVIVDRLPGFLEAALANYRSAFGPLPAPPIKLDTFVMTSRGEWARLTQQLMGSQAELYLKIPRGGYAAGGQGVYYSIGAFDSMSIAAHEGWHQYTQRTFRESLPVWLEEGIATTMEGHRWDGSTPLFLAWSNIERFDQLRIGAGADQLMSLDELLSTSPQKLLNEGAGSARSGGSNKGLNYYAQVWALTLFLRDGEGGKYRSRLHQLVADAASGHMSGTVSQAISREGSAGAAGGRPDRSTYLATRVGPAVFSAYFTDNLAQASEEYARFIERVVATGSRELIVEGRSPLR